MDSEIIGHTWATDVLLRHLRSGATRHAYLMTGAEGVGRSTVADWFVRALLCTSAGGKGPPCGECGVCSLISRGAHPDVHWFEGEGGLKIDDVRKLQHELSLSPYQANRRVAVMPDFETATTEAANALLKTLEEPPPNVVLVLTAATEESVLPTIVSRCEVIALRPMAIGDLAKALEKRGEPADRARMLAGQAMGRPGLAIRLSGDAEQVRQRSLLIEDGLRVLGMTRAGRFEYAAEVNHHKEPADNRKASILVLEAWLSLWRDVLHQIHGVQGQMTFPEFNLDVEKVAARVDPDQVVVLLREIENALRRIASNANPLLAMETIMLALPMVQLA
ncbi:MAG: DNA polymerase III subunit delta' [Anaerolineales bacterium]